MFDDQLARGSIFISHGIYGALLKLTDLREHAFGNFGAHNVLRSFVGLGLHEQPQIRRVREQAALAGFDGIGQALASEYFVVEYAEAAAVQSEWAGILQPQSAQGPAGAGGAAPQRNPFRFEFGLHDRHERRLIFLERDTIFYFVLEEIAEALSTCGGFHAA